MSVTTPKTIVISTLGGRIQSKSPMAYAPHISPVITEDYMENGVKKRRRLTHLSPDERMMRRKLKNRVAAQTARDRKKERMGQLEDEVQQLIEENRKLQEENEKLRLKSKTLSVENNQLRTRLCSGAGDEDDMDSECSDVSLGLERVAPESAALTFPPQQDRPRTPVSMTTHFMITMFLTYSLNCLASSSKSAQWPTSSRAKTVTLTSSHRRRHHPVVKRLRTPWWGSHQRSWNPASN